MPSVQLDGPRLFGDNGGEFSFGKLRVGASHAVEFTLKNDGIIPATVRYEAQSTSPHFSVLCPRSLPLEPKARHTFQVKFHPQEQGELSFPVRISTLHNPYEDARIAFQGEGYSDAVAWDLRDAPPAPQAADGKAQGESLQHGFSSKVVNYAAN